MSKKDFVHLHLHTQYSLLDGAIHIEDLFKKIHQFGSKSVAITDHGSLFGVPDFYKQALKNKIKPIIGCEVYISPGSRNDRKYAKDEIKNYHLILLAKNNKGLKNLQYLVSKGYLEGFYYKPRIDKEILSEYSEGLIGLSACMAGEPARHILRNDFKRTCDAAKEYEDILGKDNYFLEIQENGLDDQQIINKGLIDVSKKTSIPLVATNDCHFLNKDDYASHKILMCIQLQMTMSNQNKSLGHPAELYVKSPDEMWEDFKDLPEACLNTLRIAERCNVSMEFGNLHLPHYNVPDNYTLNSYLEHVVREGLHQRLANIPVENHPAYHNRLENELKIITMKGYAGYFLIVWDFIKYAKEHNVPVGPGRGSGAGSLAAYALKITDIDPIRFNLLFERFLNPERKSLPDFDVDFCMNKRENVINYVKEKYGKEKVGQIVVFSKLKPRATIRDVGRVLEIPLSIIDKLAKKIPGTPGMTMKKALSIDKSLKENITSIERGEELLLHTLKLEGLLRQTGMHAGGIVIVDKPLVEYVPLCKGQNNEMLTQYEKDTLEDIGLVKFDFLGLKNLTIIDYAIKLIKQNCETTVDLDTLPLDDKKTYELLSKGDTTGIFQLESPGMRNLLKKLKPTLFEDIIALVALYRPGPIGSGMLDDFVLRKHGQQAIQYPLPVLEDILKETYGIIVYQEQVMQIAQIIAGYSLGNADILRRAMGKKKIEEMKQQREIFIHGNSKMEIHGAIKNGFNAKKAEKIFDLMEMFAEYGFNKSHSAAYAMLAYQTAYLKTHYPVEYMAALLSCELDKGDKIVAFIEECKKMNIKILPPDINESYKDFTIDKDSIRFGLAAIKNVGVVAIENIIKYRENHDIFTDIYDFCKKIDLFSCNRKVIESLVKAGAFDVFGKNRKQHLQILDQALEEGHNNQKLKKQGVTSIDELLNNIDDTAKADEYYPDIPEMAEKDLLQFEKEVLGFFITSHPLSAYSTFLEPLTRKTSEQDTFKENSKVSIGGLVKNIKIHITKNNAKMAFFTLEDLEGEIDIVLFPKIYNKNIQHLEEDNLLIVKGSFSTTEKGGSLLADELLDIDNAIEHLAKQIIIKLSLLGFTEERINSLKSLLTRYKGKMPVILEVTKPSKFIATIRLTKSYNIKPVPIFFKQLEDLIGVDCYKINLENGESI